MAGIAIYMHGGISGDTYGNVSQTNATVFLNPPYAPLTGMCSATYECAVGDSGAGIFAANTAKLHYAYGVQSSGLFNKDTGDWAGTSYFTPSNLFS